MANGFTNPWEDYEDNFLKENFFDMSTADISKELGRSVCSIRTRAIKLKLNRENKRSHGYIISKVFRDLKFAPVPDFVKR